MKKLVFVLGLVVGCGDAFAPLDDSTLPDGGSNLPDSDRVDTASETSGNVETSSDVQVSDATTEGGASPMCGEEETYPQKSPTCEMWMKSTDFPLVKACCRQDTHTCGQVIQLSPYCIPLPGWR